MKNTEIKPKEIFAGNVIQANMVKNLLENVGIEAYLNDEIIGTIMPWQATPGGAGGVKVTVNKLEYEKAKTVVENYENSINDDNQ